TRSRPEMVVSVSKVGSPWESAVLFSSFRAKQPSDSQKKIDFSNPSKTPYCARWAPRPLPGISVVGIVSSIQILILNDYFGCFYLLAPFFLLFIRYPFCHSWHAWRFAT